MFGKDLDLSGWDGISNADFHALAPTRWPVTDTRQGGRFFANGQFFHAGGKAKMLAVSHRAPATKREPKYPFRLNTRRIRDQWHTMTRTGLSPRLSSHLAEPFVDIHPQDAEGLGINAADLLQITSPHGQSILRARITSDVRPGDVFAPIHWTGETAPSARIDQLVAPFVDPVSGQPESKASVVALQPYKAAWHGFAICADDLDPVCNYWARARTPQGWRAELAGVDTPADWEVGARKIFNLPEATAQVMRDPAKGTARIAFHDGGRLLAALFVAPEPVAVMRDYLAGLPGNEAEGMLTGRAPLDLPDPGPVVCSCFSVGINTILDAIETRGLMTVDATGEALEAGTNCGSCRPEIAELLARVNLVEAAE